MPLTGRSTGAASRSYSRIASMSAVGTAIAAVAAVPGPPALATATVLVVALAVVVAWLDARLKSRSPQLTYADTPFNRAVLSRCPTLRSEYRCTPGLTNGHAETILVAKLRAAPGVDYRREILLMKDGGAVAIDWEHHDDAGRVRSATGRG